MASYNTDILTADSRPLSEVLAFGQELVDEYNQHDNLFQRVLGRTVDNRTFRKRTSETAWEQVGEGERPHVGAEISTESMGFTIDEFSHAVGWTRNEVEDNPANLLEDQLGDMVAAADDLVFEQTMNVVQNGIADGTELEWTSPPSPAGRSFDKSHNHVFDGTNSDAGANTNPLFDDSNAHTLGEHIAKGATELTHHKYAADLAVIAPEDAYKLTTERNDSYNWQIREARDLLTTPIDQIEFNIAGTRVVQSAEIPAGEQYIFSTSEKPLYYNWVRPVEMAQENGAPVVDPSDLLQAVGSARFGVKMVNPFAGVKIAPDNVA